MTHALRALLIMAAGVLLGHAAYTVWQGASDDVRVAPWGPDVRWISPVDPSYQGYFRHEFYVESTPTAAWLQLSADSNFELYVNGRLVSRESSPTNASKGLADGLDSQIEQKINTSRGYRTPKEPMLSLWSSPDWKLCIYEDIGKYLTSGRNVIAVAVGSSLPQPRLALEGGVQVTPDRQVSLNTGDAHWKAATRAENNGETLWYDPEFGDESWSAAARLGRVEQRTYSRLSRAAFEQGPRGQWISGPQSASGEVWLRSHWNISDLRSRAVLRTASNASAGVMINGRLIDDPEWLPHKSGRVIIYDVSRLLHRGDNDVAVRLIRPFADEQPALGGAALQFFADGWVEGADGSLSSAFATDESWTAVKAPTEGWYRGEGPDQAALLLGSQRLEQLSRAYRGDASHYDYLTTAGFLGAAIMGGVAGVAGLMYLLMRYWLPAGMPTASAFNAALALLMPATFVAGAVALLTHRYRESDIALLLTDYRSSLIALVAFSAALYFSLLCQWLAGLRQRDSWASGWRFAALAAPALVAVLLAWNEPPVWAGALNGLAGASLVGMIVSLGSLSGWRERTRRLFESRLAVGLVLAALVAGGFLVRMHNLSVQDLWPDENTSLDAVRGIFRSGGGAPVTTSGIWYTRSPAYHYGVAAWLYVFGDTVNAARIFSVVCGTGLLVVAYLMTRELTKNVGLSLLVTAFLAIDPWLFALSRIIRFYVVVELLTLLCFYLFVKGFIERERAGYRYGFLVALALAMLNQELMITLGPIFFLGFLMFYRPFRLREEWPLVLAGALTLAVFFFDIFVFHVKCLTPAVALGSTTDSIVKPHLKYVTGFFSGFFLGSSRVHVVFSFFFFIGLVHSIARRDWRRVFLFASVLLYLVELTVLLRQISLRYTSPLYPLFVILSITSAFELARSLAARFEHWAPRPTALRFSLTAIMLATLLLGQEYPRLLSGTNQRLVRGTTELARYIRYHAGENDIVISPASPVAAVELGGLDYFISGSLLFFDVPYRDGNFIRDRWGGGVLVSNTEAFSRIFETADRVWIYFDDLSDARLSPAMRYCLRTTGRPVMESFAATLRVWDRQRDPFPLSQREGRDIGAY